MIPRAAKREGAEVDGPVAVHTLATVAGGDAIQALALAVVHVQGEEVVPHLVRGLAHALIPHVLRRLHGHFHRAISLCNLYSTRVSNSNRLQWECLRLPRLHHPRTTTVHGLLHLHRLRLMAEVLVFRLCLVLLRLFRYCLGSIHSLLLQASILSLLHGGDQGGRQGGLHTRRGGVEDGNERAGLMCTYFVLVM